MDATTGAGSNQPSEQHEQHEQPGGGKRKRTPAADPDEPKTVKTEHAKRQPITISDSEPAWKKLAMQLLVKGKVSTAAVANAIKDMAKKHGETIDVYSLYEDELGLDPARINDLVLAMDA